uniref:Ribosomal protein S20 n=1 Tax=Mallomonas splendens TaxID=52552 RepID=A0A3G2QZI8_9STRA|nr:ribosomal protein S20 [Mallomonas splendens]AYO28504.1 ribosomal protein S20 [Mallomonas splendens]
MNKKQRNRKIVTQNRRNKLINRRYSSTIKTLFKLFIQKTKNFSIINPKETTFNQELKKIVSNLYSMIDKAVKKGVIHKNTAARKKSKIGQIYVKTH